MLDTCKKILPVTVLLLSVVLSAVAQDTGMSWYELEEAQVLAKENNKKILIFAEASWCHNCKKMKQEVFPSEVIRQTMETYYYPVKIDIESEEILSFKGKKMTQLEFSRKLRVTGTPTFFFIDQEGSVLGVQPGFMPRNVYKTLLTYMGTDAYKEVDFEEYANQN